MTPNDTQQRNRDRLAEVNRQLSELYKQIRQLEREKSQLEVLLHIPMLWKRDRHWPERREYDEW